MKRNTKRGHARKGREIAMIHKTLVSPSGSLGMAVYLAKLVCHLTEARAPGYIGEPCLYSRSRHSASDYDNSWKPHLKGFPPLSMGVSLQNVPPMSLSSTCCIQTNTWRWFNPACPVNQLMTGGHLWQGTQSADHMGILPVTRKLYQQLLVYGSCWAIGTAAEEV